METSIIFEWPTNMIQTLKKARETWTTTTDEDAPGLIVTELLHMEETLGDIWQITLSKARKGKIKNYPQQGKAWRYLYELTTNEMTATVAAFRKEAERTGEEIPRLEELERMAERMRSWADRELSQWPWVETAPLPIDPAMVEASVASRKRGESQLAADVLARVRAGGPFVKE